MSLVYNKPTSFVPSASDPIAVPIGIKVLYVFVCCVFVVNLQSLRVTQHLSNAPSYPFTCSSNGPILPLKPPPIIAGCNFSCIPSTSQLNQNGGKREDRRHFALLVPHYMGEYPSPIRHSRRGKWWTPESNSLAVMSGSWCRNASRRSAAPYRASAKLAGTPPSNEKLWRKTRLSIHFDYKLKPFTINDRQ